MPEKEKSSQTMRIDLIPDVPSKPMTEKKKRVVIAPPTRKHTWVKTKILEKGKNSRYQELLQSVYDAAFITDLNGRIIDVNVRAIEFFLYNRNELCNLTIFDVISGASDTLIQTLWENLGNERFTLIQAYCVRKDGTFFPSEISVNKLRLGQMCLCFFLRDITIRRQQEEMLRTEHTAIQNSGNGIAVTNLDAKLEYVNPAVTNMWGFDALEELIGKDVRDLLSDKEAADKMVRTVMSNHETWTAEMKGRRNDTSEFDLQVSATCNRNSDGESVGIVLSFVDISDRKRAEEAIKEAERQRVMLESLGAACHHLGQPATVLLANISIIRKKLDTSDATVNELVQASIEAAETLRDVLHKLSAVNKYRTTEYLKRPEGSDSSESRILEI